MNQYSCLHCEQKKFDADLVFAANGGPCLFLVGVRPTFKPTKMMCFAACCDLCNSCHHYLCCACFRRGVRVDYRLSRFIEPEERQTISPAK